MIDTTIGNVACRFPGMVESNGNLVHQSAVIGPGVKLGRGNFIGPFTSIVGNVEIGDDNWIGPNVTIGTAAQYHGPRNEWKEMGFLPIRIGSGNTLREYVTVHEASESETVIEDDCYLMAYNHLSHDSRLRSKVTLANNVQIGGFTDVGYASVLGLSTTIHQFTTIGAFVMVGMSSAVTKDLPPFTKFAGNPARFLGINSVGLSRNGFSEGELEAIRAAVSGDSDAYPERAESYLTSFRERNAQTHRQIARCDERLR